MKEVTRKDEKRDKEVKRGMQKKFYLTRRRELIKLAGLTFQEVHRETDIPESTFRWYAGVIPLRDGVLLLHDHNNVCTFRREGREGGEVKRLSLYESEPCGKKMDERGDLP